MYLSLNEMLAVELYRTRTGQHELEQRIEATRPGLFRRARRRS